MHGSLIRMSNLIYEWIGLLLKHDRQVLALPLIGLKTPTVDQYCPLDDYYKIVLFKKLYFQNEK